MKMAFQNLFKKLFPTEDGVRDPGRTTSARMTETENCFRPNVPRRHNQEEREPHKKRRREQEQLRAADDVGLESRIRHPDQHTSISNHTGVRHHRSNKGQNYHMCHKRQTFQHKNNKSSKKRMDEQEKSNERERGRHVPRGGGHESMRGGGRVRRDHTQEVKDKCSRFMTQEFQEQNVLLVDGRLLCRHFLWGRCIKGDACQLEHVQGYNDLIKKLCKFYVQGFCSKGKDCPYMHQSFPCKFFHRKGYCSQGPDCRFSHEPLNDVTSKLCDEILKNDELQQLAKKAEEESSEQPKQPVSSERGSSCGVVLQQLRPSFYQSADTNVESEAAFCVTEEQADVDSAADVQSAAGEASQPVSLPSSPQQPAEPICYSVEAVLGPQWSRPFTRLFPAPGQKEFQPLYSAESVPANQSRVPYAGNAGLSARKATEDPVLGQRFSSEPHLKEVRLPQLSPDPVHETVSCWNRPQENRLRSVLHAGLESKRCWNLPLTSAKLWKSGEKTEASQPSPQAFHEATFADGRCSINSTTDGGPHCKPTKSGDSADPGGLLLKVQEPRESQRALKPGSEQYCSAENPAERSADSADLRQPFSCPFATPLSESLKWSHRPALIQSCPASQSADGRTNQPDRAPSSFLNLFAAPLGAAPFPPQSSLHSQIKQKGKMEMVFSRLEPAEEQPASQKLSPNPSRSQCEETRVAEEAQPDVASQAERPAASSLLKTLFCSLKPYQDGEKEHAQMLQISEESSRSGFGGF